MDKIPTAKELIEQYCTKSPYWSTEQLMQYYAKLHVKAALEAQINNCYCDCKFITNLKTGECRLAAESILNTYPDTNIV